MEVIFKTATECMPICREELFLDVLCKKVYGDVSKVWHFPGHIIVVSNESRKLFTFDCKPLANQQGFDCRYLDLPILNFPVINCLQLSPNVLVLADSSGSLRSWEFTTDFKWNSLGDHHLNGKESNTFQAPEIISITYLTAVQTLVWCEAHQSSTPSSLLSSERQAEYRLCRKTLFKDGSIPEERDPAKVIVKNCPKCDVLALSEDVLLVSSQYDRDQVTVHLMIDFIDEKVVLIIGDDIAEIPTSSLDQVIDFPDIVMVLLASLVKVEPGLCDLGVKSCTTNSSAVALSSSGRLDVFSCRSETGKRELKKTDVHLNVSAKSSLTLDGIPWFLHQSLVGILMDGSICLYNVSDGSLVSTSNVELQGNVHQVVSSSSPVFLAWILTSSQLYALQGSKPRAAKDVSSYKKLPDNELLQTSILRLAQLQQQKTENYDLEARQELETLSKIWADNRNIPQEDHISRMFGPHLDEYWRLEKLSKALLNVEKPLTCHSETADLLVSSLMESRTFSMEARHSKLMWLSQVYPEELLAYLCRGLSIDLDYIQQAELKQWQILLGLNGSDLMNFQFVCRLLFELYPSKLFNFVRCSEDVCEQTVGISAFVRKKHSLIYYKSACECLPDSSSSKYPQCAESAKARLILASETDNCVEKALKSLLEHGLWSEAVEILKEQAGDEEKLPTYLYITTAALVKNQVVSDYMEQLFELMSSWKSLKFFSHLAAERPEIRQQQLSNSASDVFHKEERQHGERGTSLGAVKSSLSQLVQKMNVNK